MAIAMRGLKVKPTYEQLVGVASSDGLEQTKFPNRDAPSLRSGFILSQFDGEGMRAMEEQQQRHITVDFRNFIVLFWPRLWHIEIRHRVQKKHPQ